MEAITAWLDANAGGADLLWLLLAIGGAVCLFAYGVSIARGERHGSGPPAAGGSARYAQGGGGRAARPRLGSSTRWRATSCRKRPRERDSTQTRLIQAGFRVAAGAAQLLRHRSSFSRSRCRSRARRRALAAAALDEHDLLLRRPRCLRRRSSARSSCSSILRQRRIKRLRNGLPDALDLLVVCVESGLGLAPAIERVARELEFSHPDLAQELSLVNAEMRAGVERPVALRNLAHRSGVDDINGLVGLLGADDPLRHERRRSPARVLRGVPRQAHAKGRGASGEDRHEDDLPARAVPVSVVLHRRHRTGSPAHHRGVQADVSRAARHGGLCRCKATHVAA